MSAIISKASDQDTRFVAHHESPGGRAITRAYLCPAGVVTIGHGFTWGSRTFRDFWMQTRGHRLRMGDTITQGEADQLLRRLIDEEYGAAVAQKARPKKQHHFGSASSMSFNCGTGALGWRWAQALAAGNISEAARLLRTTAVTANGRRLPGLVRRRGEEARLMEHGLYTTDGPANRPTAVSQTDEEIKQYQDQLKTLGYYSGNLDGIAGRLTDKAVRNFQREHELKVDGIVGPATRAALIRALDAKRGNQAMGGAGGAGAVGGGGPEIASQTTDALINALMWGTAAVIVVGIAVVVLRYRGKLTGQRVPT